VNGKCLVILVGTISHNIEVFGQPDKLVVKAKLPTTEVWTDKNGEKHESTEWHSLVFFGRLAKVANKWLHKGCNVYIEGKNKTRKWVDNNKNEKYYTDIVVDVLEILGARGKKKESKSTGRLSGNNSLNSTPNPKHKDDHMDNPIT
jgi:single-strand DNA-binding protein